jgi:osmotically-inducible protein OsmY
LLVLLLALAPLASSCAKTVVDTRDDLTITARVKTALLNDPTVGGLRLEVDTSKGIVTLSGTVKTPADADRAVAISRKVAGVRDVQSSLKIQP